MGRRIGNITLFSFSVLLITTSLPATSYGQTAFVIGGGFAQECYVAVKYSSPVRAARTVCNRALETEALTSRDNAATLVNRGILSVRERDGEAALSDFNAALRVDPGLSSIFLNRASAYLLQGRWLDAKVDADTAIGIGLKDDEWAAYFNKGIALEQLGQVADAYAALQRSAALAPNREEARKELARFRVGGAQ